MAEEFEGRDLSGAVFWGVDLRGATMRDVDLTGARMHGVWLVDVAIDGLVDGLVINGVDVTGYVNAHDPWQPLRGMLRPSDRAGLLATLDEVDRAWGETIEQARSLPDDLRHRSVDGEWSFVQTLRHLVMGIDKWFTAPVTGGSFHAIGLPNTGSLDVPFPGIDLSSDPSFDEAVAVRGERMALIREHLAGLADGELERVVDVMENGPHTVLDCLHTVFEEAFEHLRYARRDLAQLNA